MSKKLWTRHASHFIVEIQVGKTWAHYAKTEDKNEALNLASEAIADKSVTRSRILEHDITHVCNEVHVEDQTAVFRVPPKMTLADRDELCPLCNTLSPVTNDGQDEWIFCGPCKRAFPSQAA